MDELEQILEEMLYMVYTKFVYGEEKILKDMLGDKITSKEIHTLDVIYTCAKNGRNTGSEIAKSLGITISTCTINIDRLIAKGYVEKVRHEADKRISYITLTNEGNLIRQKQQNARKNAIKRAIRNLSQTEKVALINGISKIEFK